MRTASLGLVGLVCATLLFGCTLSYDQAIALAKIGGEASARTWVVAAKPTAAQVAVVSGALDVTNTALLNYSGSGDFADALPQIYQGIDELWAKKGYDPQLLPLADSLASAVVYGVDFWFSQNPSWKAKGAQSAQIASAFVMGAQAALPKSLQSKAYVRSIAPREVKKAEAPKAEVVPVLPVTVAAPKVVTPVVTPVAAPVAAPVKK